MATAVTQTEQHELEPHRLSSPAPWAQQTSDPEPPRPEEGSGRSGGGRDTATILKVVSASFSFFVAGVNDGSVGAIIPYVIREYNVNTAIVSSM